MWRAKKWGLDPNRVLDLGIYIIIAALVCAKLLLLVVDFDQFNVLTNFVCGWSTSSSPILSPPKKTDPAPSSDAPFAAKSCEGVATTSVTFVLD